MTARSLAPLTEQASTAMCRFAVGETPLEIIAHPGPPQADEANTIYASFELGGQCFVVRKVQHHPAAVSPLMSLLTNRERDIVHAVAAGLRNKQIAHELHLSEYTVAAYIKQICYKLQVRNRTAIVTRCMQLSSSGEDGLSASAAPQQLRQVMEGAFKPGHPSGVHLAR